MINRTVPDFLKVLCGIAVMLALVAGIASLPVFAVSSGIYIAKATPHYKHPVTGEIEDAGGDGSAVLGQSMTESATYKKALVEIDSDGNTFITVRLQLMDNIKNPEFKVDGKAVVADVMQENYGSKSTDCTADYRMRVTDINSIIRCSMYVIPMGRDVVFYITVSDLQEGSEDFVTVIKVDPLETTVTTTLAPPVTTPATDATTTTPQSSITTTPQTSITTTPQTSITTTPQTSVTTTPQTSITTTPQSSVITTPQSSVITTPQSSSNTTPQSSSNTTPQSSSTTTPQSSVTTTTQSSVITTPQSSSNTTPQSSSTTTPQTSTTTTEQSSVTTTVQASTTTTSQVTEAATSSPVNLPDNSTDSNGDESIGGLIEYDKHGNVISDSHEKESVEQNTENTGNAFVPIIVAVLIFAAVGFIGYFVFLKRKHK